MPDDTTTTTPATPDPTTPPVDPNDDLVTQIEAKQAAVKSGLQNIRDVAGTLAAEQADAKAKILAATAQVQADHDAHTKLVQELVTQLADEEDTEAQAPTDPAAPAAKRRL